MSIYRHTESALIHGGNTIDPLTGAVNIPVYQTSTFQQKALGLHPEWEYARTGNPTRAALERLIAELEEGIQGFAFASGMAAITAVLSLFRAGDRVLISSNVYGGTYRVLDKVFSAFDLHYAIADTDDLNELEKEITPDVKAILVESPANPLMTVTDIQGVAELAKRHHVLTIVDNTFSQYPLQQIPVNGVSSKNLNNFGKMGRAEKRVMIFIRRDIPKQKQRQQTSEHPFGTMKHYDGAGYFLCKGKEKVTAEYALSFLGYDIRRAITICGGVKSLIQRFKGISLPKLPKLAEI